MLIQKRWRKKLVSDPGKKAKMKKKMYTYCGKSWKILVKLGAEVTILRRYVKPGVKPPGPAWAVSFDEKECSGYVLETDLECIKGNNDLESDTVETTEPKREAEPEKEPEQTDEPKPEKEPEQEEEEAKAAEERPEPVKKKENANTEAVEEETCFGPGKKSENEKKDVHLLWKILENLG